MFGIGFPELLVIAVVALIFVGPKKLPEVMRQAGKLFVQLRRTANDVRSTFDQVVREAEEELRRSEIENLRKALAAQEAALKASMLPPAAGSQTGTSAQTIDTTHVAVSQPAAPAPTPPLEFGHRDDPTLAPTDHGHGEDLSLQPPHDPLPTAPAPATPITPLGAVPFNPHAPATQAPAAPAPTPPAESAPQGPANDKGGH